MKGFALSAILFSAVAIIGPAAVNAAFNTYPGCQDLEPGHFRAVKLFDITTHPALREPIRLDFVKDAEGNVHFYFIELRNIPHEQNAIASLKYYDSGTETVSLVGEISVDGRSNDGMSGMVLDPGFSSNRWIYFQYSIGEVFRLSRFTILPDNTLDTGSETIIAEITSRRGQVHTGGAMDFDDYGDLWWSVGDNSDLEGGPANTHDLRGKLNRIHPLPVQEGTTDWGVGKTYTIPQGNMGEYMAQEYPARASEFLDTSRVRPEVYAMGLRNGYTLTLDPVRRWATYGDCGPDGRGGQTEEDDLLTRPGNMGWPYFAGDNQSLMGKDAAAPRNTSQANTGLEFLPPAVPATYSYPQACAMTGPVYRYDPNLVSDVKMPPHFHRLWFITEYNLNWIMAFRMDQNGQNILESDKITDNGNLFDGMQHTFINRPLDFKAGPDGAFYIISYGGFYTTTLNTSIIRIEYAGPSCDVGPEFVVEKAGCTTPGDPAYDPDATHHNPQACGVGTLKNRQSLNLQGVRLSSGSISLPGPGPYRITITSSDGKHLRTLTGAADGPKDVSLFESWNINTGPGLYLISVRTENGVFSGKMAKY